MSPAFVVVSIYFLFGAAALAIYFVLSNDRRLLRDKVEDIAIEARVSRGLFDALPSESRKIGRSMLLWAARRIPAPRLDTPSVGKMMRTLQQAGFRKAASLRVFQLVRLGASAAGAVAGFSAALLLSLPGAWMLFWIGAGVAAGLFAPAYYVGKRARSRQRSIARELSDVMDLLVVCVEAGLGLHQAIKVVGNELDEQGAVIGRELAEVAGEMAAGRTLAQALRAFADRTGVEEVKPLAATLAQSEQMGASIAPALRASSDALRDARRMRAEEDAQKTTVKILFPLVLFVLPAMMIVVVGPSIVQILRTFHN